MDIPASEELYDEFDKQKEYFYGPIACLQIPVVHNLTTGGGTTKCIYIITFSPSGTYFVPPIMPDQKFSFSSEFTVLATEKYLCYRSWVLDTRRTKKKFKYEEYSHVADLVADVIKHAKETIEKYKCNRQQFEYIINYRKAERNSQWWRTRKKS